MNTRERGYWPDGRSVIPGLPDLNVCGCGHDVRAHDGPSGACGEWWRYPDVLNARQCGCKRVWHQDATA